MVVYNFEAIKFKRSFIPSDERPGDINLWELEVAGSLIPSVDSSQWHCQVWGS